METENIRNIFDSHCHYADRAFDGDREELLAALPGKGVRYAALISCDLHDMELNCALSQRYDWLYTTVGIHPENAGCVKDGYLDILRRAALDNPKVRAVGEIGLDYHYPGFSRERQIQVFREQISLAGELGLPVVIHSRDAAEDTLSILRELRPAGVMHCFSYSAETAAEIIDLGMYIGFTGVLTFKNARKPLRALERVPDDRLLLETDCPYMAPEPFRGKRCDSSMIAYTAQRAAQLRGVDVQELLDMTCENAMRFYGIR